VTTVILGTNETSAWPHFGGSLWVRLQYLLGLQRLGIDTYWVDRLAPPDTRKNPHSVDYLDRRFRGFAEDFGFADRYCIVYAGGERHFGMDERRLDEVTERADLLLNVSGRLEPGDPLLRVRRRAFLDVDPGFTQIWALQTDMHLERHHVFFTIGQNVGGPAFPVPTGDLDWQPTLPPVVLERWPPVIEPASSRIGTVADLRGSQDAIYEGEWFSGKREQFLGFLRVPSEAGVEMDVALLVGQEDYEDLGILLRHGWRVRDPYSHAGDPHSYREFIQSSRAEFSVAKQGYVRTRSGWISDRTACYLASGKPAIVQSTGFEHRLPTGTGLLTFSTVGEAVTALQQVQEDYLAHAHAARRLAEDHFDSDAVLANLLKRAGIELDVARSGRGQPAAIKLDPATGATAGSERGSL
jgi:hypothetical protein